ncbi:hypothetical protein HLB44_35375 [Aquincola sp. S2]|uniref:Zinc ribbon domain-containing protein n=1 Tax=Pseudaquabacterium terrae TaxID=2732868 RepID=A0ABX2EUX0_9BURK|nr:hypothetical protein [Aquabacterium terrae]NRF72280.1 hypothetical protein [Aquabacterium terrae]
MDLAFILTCYRCRSEFLHPDRGSAYCMHCAAPPLGIRGDGQVVQHQARPVPRHYVEATPRAPQLLVQATHAQRDEDGMLRIYRWRLTSSTTGKQYVTKRRLSAEAARGIDPNAQPVGAPETIRGYGQASTSAYMGAWGPEQTAAGGEVTRPQEGPLPGWRDGQQHQWSRDPGRGRCYR